MAIVMEHCSWDPVIIIAEQLQLVVIYCKNVLKLLNEDCTIPFIARYRKEMTNNMPVDKLRQIQELYEELKAVDHRVGTVLKAIEKLQKMTPTLKAALTSATTMLEVEQLYAPFKPGSKRTLAERARELGLEEVALQVLKEPYKVNLNSWVKAGTKGLSKLSEVTSGIQHIIADIIAKDKDALDNIREFINKQLRSPILLRSTLSKNVTKDKASSNEKKSETSKTKGKAKTSNTETQKSDAVKYEQYYDFSKPLKYLKPHEIMAINRGESHKILTVKIEMPEIVKQNFVSFCKKKFIHHQSNQEIRQLMEASIEDAWARLVEPNLIRQFRSDLTKSAQKTSVELFSSNLKRLLLMPPVRGRVVMGVDPGFRNGCKIAVISQTGQVLDTCVNYALVSKNNHKEVEALRGLLQKHRCETVAIGNGTACRQTEELFSNLIKSKFFSPLNVMYCIVNESGASIYSVSDIAQKEMPDLDPSLRGAVSIARRLQDPLVELVKTEPKHIGVGMYQHDIPDSQLKTALDGVVEECVSFVGVDVNVSSELILRHISGLNVSLAKKIVDFRNRNGEIKNRQQLLSIKGLGPKTFQQCAGFLRINLHIHAHSINEGSSEPVVSDPSTKPSTSKKRKAGAAAKAGGKKRKLTEEFESNCLDKTWIHPESYPITMRFLEKISASAEEIGQESMHRKIDELVQKHGIDKISSELAVGIPTLGLIIDGLKQPVGYDFREEYEKPIFKQGIVSIDSLTAGTVLTGRVSNVVSFGAFVDIGVGQDALIHTSKMPATKLKGKMSLETNDKVEVKVLNVDVNRKRISLMLMALLS